MEPKKTSTASNAPPDYTAGAGAADMEYTWW
jgi:hypothetical protein